MNSLSMNVQRESTLI